MKIIQTTGFIKDGEITVKVPQNLKEQKVEVIVLAENEPDEWELIRKLGQEQGYNSAEQILDLIKQVKLEMLAEKEMMK